MITLTRRSLTLWAAGTFALVGVPLFVAAIVLIQNDRRFARDARSTDGTVITKQIRTTGGRQSRSRSKHYEATYRFTVEGRTVEGRDTLSADAWTKLTEGRTVEVLYLPGDPESNHLPGHDSMLVHLALLAVAGVFTTLGAALLLRSIRRARVESQFA